jgi:thioredoxin-related protein
MSMRALRIVAVLLALVWAGCVHGAQPSPHAIDIPKWFAETFLDIREDIAEAKRQDKRLMIYFGQDGCPYCKALMKGNFGQPDIEATTRRHFMPVALNLWGDREVTWLDGRRMPEKELARVLGVQFTPTLLFFDEDGAVALRLNGYSPPDKFRQALAYVSRRMEKRQSYPDYLAGQPPENAEGRLATQPSFERAPADLPRVLRASRQPVIVLFERKFCSDCIEMHREGFTRPEVRRLLERFRVVQVDLSDARELARSMNVVYTPSLVFFEPGGKEVFRAEGYLKPFHLASALDYVASGAYRGEPSFQRYIRKRADGLRAGGATVDLW